MRTITDTITTNVYTFDELSEDAKDKVIDFLRVSQMEIDADEMVECLEEAMCRLNIGIDDYEIDIDGSGYINLSIDDSDVAELEGVRAYKWIVNNLFADVRKSNLYWIEGNFDKQRYSNIEQKDWMENYPFSGMCYDYAVKDAWDEWCEDLKNGYEPSVQDFLNDIGAHYLKELSGEYYGFGEEEARDIAESNDFEFLEDGTIY